MAGQVRLNDDQGEDNRNILKRTVLAGAVLFVFWCGVALSRASLSRLDPSNKLGSAVDRRGFENLYRPPRNLISDPSQIFFSEITQIYSSNFPL